MISDVALQRRTSGEQRPFLVENAEIHPGHRAGGVTEADHQAATLQTIQRGFPGVFAHRVIHYAHLFTAGDLFHPLHNALFAVVDHLPGTRLKRALCLLRVADGADQFGAQRFCPLTGNQPNAACGRVEQELFIGFDLIGFAQQIKHR